jgi:hypothetical protein
MPPCHQTATTLTLLLPVTSLCFSHFVVKAIIWVFAGKALCPHLSLLKSGKEATYRQHGPSITKIFPPIIAFFLFGINDLN